MKAPPPRSSPYAEEGTRAHECLDKILKTGSPIRTLKELEAKYGSEMLDHAATAADLILTAAIGADFMHCETKVDLSFVHPGAFGTVDAAVVREFDELTVIDFKYGAGHAVSPENNSQLIYYALGLAHLHHYNFAKVRLVIIQPRVEGGKWSEWTMSISDLKTWAEKFKRGIRDCEAPDPYLLAGEHCKFCPAKVICPEISNKALAQAKLEFRAEPPGALEVKVPDVGDLILESVPAILDAIPRVETWIEAVKEYAFNQLSAGKPIRGYKLVEKRGTRKWLKPGEVLNAEAIERFGPKCLTEPELKSPAQFEKLGEAAAEFVKENSTSVSSGLTMVKDTDKRPSTSQVQIDFAEPVQSESAWKSKNITKKGKKKT